MLRINKTKLRKKLLFVFFIVILCFTLSTVYGANDTSNMKYTITSDLSDNDIQNMLNNALDGDTFNFIDSQYDDISLVVDKRVNIISNANSQIYTSNIVNSKDHSLDIAESFGFYFTPNSAGSILSGFKIISNSDYSIITVGSNNTKITDCSISGGNKGGILVKDSSDFYLNNNIIKNTKGNGLYILNSEEGTIYKNTIYNNLKSGILLADVNKINIDNNSIYKNSFNGISLYNNTSKLNITHNNIYQNLNGIYINSRSESDVIRANTIWDNRIDPSSELGASETGNGVLIGPDYSKNRLQPNIYYNSIYNNEQFGVKNNPSFATMTIGANWYATNNPHQSFVCPMILGRILEAKISLTSKGFEVKFFDGDSQVTDFGNPNVKFEVDGKEHTGTFRKGVASIEGYINSAEDHVVKVTFDTGESISQAFKAKNNQNQNPQNQNQSDSSSEDTVKSESLSKNNIDSPILGSNSTNSVIKDISDVGDNKDSKGQGNSAKPSNAFEVTVNKIAKTVSENSAVIIVAFIVLILLFALGYKHKNNFD